MKVERTAEPVDRTDDPVRMYLREMGSVELLSREGEIAIAKRIEAGREAMISGLCESPLTFQAIIIWRDELNEGKILLRDIIDLEATYAGPDAKTAPERPVEEELPPPPPPVENRRSIRASAAPVPPRHQRRRPGGRIWRRAERRRISTRRASRRSRTRTTRRSNVSLSAMEAELKPQVLETFDRIAKTYKSLRKLQDQEVGEKTALSSQSQERRYKKLREEIIERCEVACRSTRRASRPWSSSSMTSTSG